MEGIELLNPDECGIAKFVGVAEIKQVVVNFPGAENDSGDPAAVLDKLVVIDHLLEKCSLCHFARGGDALRVSEEAFRRHQNERLSEIPAHLATQSMKVLGGSRQIAYLNIRLGTELKEALEPCTRVFRAHPS